MTQVRVVGAGLAGLFAAVLAAERGAEVTLLARGRGSLELSHGCIDIWGQGDLKDSLPALSAHHPYSTVGFEAVSAALSSFVRIMKSNGMTYFGDLHQSMLLPTAVGSLRPTNYAPRAQAGGEPQENEPFILGKIDGFRDFYPSMIADNLRRSGVAVADIVDLPLPGVPAREFYSTDLARLFDHEEESAGIIQKWIHRLQQRRGRRLALPAVLGFRQAEQVHAKMEKLLGMPIVEIASLPPSMPGLRLERALWKAADSAGVHIVEGPAVQGIPEEINARGSISALSADTAAGERLYPADVVIMATGGILNGGVIAPQRSGMEETVLNLPVSQDSGRADWTAASLRSPQSFEKAGVRVDDTLRPIDEAGNALYENVYVVGGLLAGADRIHEGSRQGIDLASAYRVVEVALG